MKNPDLGSWVGCAIAFFEMSERIFFGVKN